MEIGAQHRWHELWAKGVKGAMDEDTGRYPAHDMNLVAFAVSRIPLQLVIKACSKVRECMSNVVFKC